MSTDALYAEVRANLPLTLVTKAADSIYSHDQRTYTHILTDVAHRGLADGNPVHVGGKKRHDSHKKSGNKEGSADKKQHEKQEGKPGSSRSHKNSRNRNRRSTSGENELASLRSEIADLHEDNAKIRKELDELRNLIQKLNLGGTPQKAPAKQEEKDADEDFDLFGSDDEEESEEAKRKKEANLAAYQAKKEKKPGPIAKSSVILDVKPWDDQTSLDEMEKLVKSIEMDGLLWGASKKVPIGYGISKLQVVCTVEDEKVSVDDLQDKIQAFEDHVQSVDIVAFNKI